MYPPSLFRISTGLEQAEHSPLDPPLTVKHDRQRKRGSDPGAANGSGYMVASGSKDVRQVAHANEVRVSLGCKIEP